MKFEIDLNKLNDDELELIVQLKKRGMLNIGELAICPKCSSYQVIRNGKRKSRYKTKQRYKCKSCNYKFTLNPSKNRYPSDIRNFVIKSKLSLRKTRDEVNKRFNINMSHVTVLSIKKLG